MALRSFPQTALRGCSAIISATLLISGVANADSLKNVMSSAEYKAFEKAERRDAKKIPEWVDLRSNYGKMFVHSNPRPLLQWLGTPAVIFSPGHTKSQVKEDYLGMTTFYETPRESLINLDIRIPRPSLLSAVKYDLVKDLSDLIPKKDTIKTKTAIQIAGVDAEMYHLTDGTSCAIIVNLSRSGVLSLSTKDCRKEDMILKFGDSLDIQRLNAKLNS